MAPRQPLIRYDVREVRQVLCFSGFKYSLVCCIWYASCNYDSPTLFTRCNQFSPCEKFWTILMCIKLKPSRCRMCCCNLQPKSRTRSEESEYTTDYTVYTAHITDSTVTGVIIVCINYVRYVLHITALAAGCHQNLDSNDCLPLLLKYFSRSLPALFSTTKQVPLFNGSSYLRFAPLGDSALIWLELKVSLCSDCLFCFYQKFWFM